MNARMVGIVVTQTQIVQTPLDRLTVIAKIGTLETDTRVQVELN